MVSTVSSSVQLDPKSSKSHLPQTLSESWLKDLIKSKYVHGKVGDLNFTCKMCKKLYDVSLYRHVDWHKKGLSDKDNTQQPSTSEFLMFNIQK